jgi:hypothetical protein
MYALATKIVVLKSQQTIKYTFESTRPSLDSSIVYFAKHQVAYSSPRSVTPVEHSKRQTREADKKSR